MRSAARMQTKQWAIKPAHPHAEQLARSLNISALTAQTLINRGLTDTRSAGAFLKPKLTELIKPEKMPGTAQAVQRIEYAIKNKQKITIYGDYDVDGITGTAILWQLLKLLDASVDYHIPHRIEEGYGLNVRAVESLAKTGTNLLITVDAGINAIEPAEAAAGHNLDLIVTDHHQPNAQLPRAAAIVHPAIDPAYPNQDSCGAMVAFKLAWAAANRLTGGKRLTPHLRDFMINATSLAAMGTVADVVDLRGENRILTSYGLKTLPQCQLPGIRALIESANLTGECLDSFHIGFRLAPMLNAAGRLGHARLAVELLTSNNPVRSMQIAEYLREQNNKRRRYEQKIFKHACQIVTQKDLNHPDRKSIVLAEEDWHPGVIGIVASRLTEKYYRPVVMINASRPAAQGSARSIEGFNLLDAIRACSQYLTTFGGHKMAAGITLRPENIDLFAELFEAYAQQNLNDEIIAKLHIDAEVSLKQLHKQAVTELQKLGPFGQGNPKPLFATKAVRLCAPPRKVGAAGSHLQLTITDNTATLRCIGFRMGAMEKKLLDEECFNVAYSPQINTYNGNSSVQLVLTDIQFD